MRVTPESEPSVAGSGSRFVILAFDFGLRRIGVAIGQQHSASARPLGAISARRGEPDWPAISRYVEEWQPGLLLVGLPCDGDGTPTRMTRSVKGFATALRQRFKLPVELVDERLTSWEAADRLKSARRAGSHRSRLTKQDVDMVAAQLILETWLSEKATRRDGPSK